MFFFQISTWNNSSWMRVKPEENLHSGDRPGELLDSFDATKYKASKMSLHMDMNNRYEHGQSHMTCSFCTDQPEVLQHCMKHVEAACVNLIVL